VLAAAALVTRFMIRIHILALPNHRSSHDTPTPSSGGVSIVLVTVIGILIYCFTGEDSSAWSASLAGLLVGSVFVSVVGLFDDLGRLSNFKYKLLSQFVAVLVLFLCDIVIDSVTLPHWGKVDLGWFGYIVTLIWVIGLTNAFNFMDGLDGMAGGAAAVAAFCFAFVAFILGSELIFVISYLVLAAIVGFLIFNFPKAKIFMGDVGSQFLGFMLAALAVVGTKGEASQIPLLVMPLLFAHFIFDTSFTFLRRLHARENVTEAHRSHLYQLINRMGWSHPKVTLLYGAMAALQGLAAIWMIEMNIGGQVLIVAGFLAIYIIFMLLVVRAARAKSLL